MGAGFAITLLAHIGKSDSSFSDLPTSHNARSIFLPCCYRIHNHTVPYQLISMTLFFNKLYNAIMESFSQKLYNCTCNFFFVCVRVFFSLYLLHCILTTVIVKFNNTYEIIKKFYFHQFPLRISFLSHQYNLINHDYIIQFCILLYKCKFILMCVCVGGGGLPLGWPPFRPSMPAHPRTRSPVLLDRALTGVSSTLLSLLSRWLLLSSWHSS